MSRTTPRKPLPVVNSLVVNYVVVVFDDGEVVKGIITGVHSDNGGGVWLHAEGAESPAKRTFSEMTSMTVTA